MEFVGFYTDCHNSLGPMFHGDQQSVYNKLCQEASKLEIELPPISYFEDVCDYDTGDLTFYIGLSEPA